MFSLIRDAHEDEEANTYGKVDQGIQHGKKSEQETLKDKREAATKPIMNPMRSCETEIKENLCPICLDSYGKIERLFLKLNPYHLYLRFLLFHMIDESDFIFHSKYCSHYFHKEW